MSGPAIELAEAEKTKALLAGVIIAGGFGRAIPHTPRNERKIAGAHSGVLVPRAWTHSAAGGWTCRAE